jgi:hypothetical protein
MFAVWRVLVVLCITVSSVSYSGSAAAEKYAFVVGIDKYDNVRGLQKARGDARAITTALEGLGFKVMLREDLTRPQFNEAWALFLSKLEPGDVAAIYFAGHGVELSGRNYLIPRDVPRIKAGRDEQLKRESLALHELQADLKEHKPRFSLWIVDACRENPFESIGTRTVGSERGLAPAEPPQGSFIIYSAGFGEEALDGLNDTDVDPNSVFTRRLLPLLKTPGLPLTAIAERVRAEVSALAGTVPHVQTPAFYSQTIGPACLAGDTCGGDMRVTANGDKTVEAARNWEKLRGTTDARALLAFIDAYPGTVQAEIAREQLVRREGGTAAESKPAAPAAKSGLYARLLAMLKPAPPPPAQAPTPEAAKPKLPEPSDEEKADWNAAERVNTAASYEAYAAKWTNGRFVDDARAGSARQQRRKYTVADVEKASEQVAEAIRSKQLNYDRLQLVDGIWEMNEWFAKKRGKTNDAKACALSSKSKSILRGMAVTFMYYNGMIAALKYNDPTKQNDHVRDNSDSDEAPTSNPRVLARDVDPQVLLAAAIRIRSKAFPLLGERAHIKAFMQELLAYKARFDEKISPRVLRRLDLREGDDYEELGFAPPADSCMGVSWTLRNVGPANTHCLHCNFDYEGYPGIVPHVYMHDFWYRRTREGTAGVAAMFLQYVTSSKD